mgnify:FL=1
MRALMVEPGMAPYSPLFYFITFVYLWGCSSPQGRKSGCGLLPAKRRLAAACGKPNALLAPPVGG